MMNWLDHIRLDSPGARIFAISLLMFAVGWFLFIFYALFDLDEE